MNHFTTETCRAASFFIRQSRRWPMEDAFNQTRNTYGLAITLAALSSLQRALDKQLPSCR